MCGWNELEVCTTMHYPHISSFRAMPLLYTSTRTHSSSNCLRTVNQQGLEVETADAGYSQALVGLFCYAASVSSVRKTVGMTMTCNETGVTQV